MVAEAGHPPPAPTAQPAGGGAVQHFSKADHPRVQAAEGHASGKGGGRKFKWTLPTFSPAQRDGKVEDRQHERACVLGEEVANDGGRDGGVAGLADAHQPPGQDQQPEVLWDRGRECWGDCPPLPAHPWSPLCSTPQQGPGSRGEDGAQPLPQQQLHVQVTVGLSFPLHRAGLPGPGVLGWNLTSPSREL